MTDQKPPSGMREFMSLTKDGTMTLREGLTEAELREVITMLAGLYHELRMKVKDAAAGS